MPDDDEGEAVDEVPEGTAEGPSEVDGDTGGETELEGSGATGDGSELEVTEMGGGRMTLEVMTSDVDVGKPGADGEPDEEGNGDGSTGEALRSAELLRTGVPIEAEGTGTGSCDGVPIGGAGTAKLKGAGTKLCDDSWMGAGGRLEAGAPETEEMLFPGKGESGADAQPVQKAVWRTWSSWQ